MRTAFSTERGFSLIEVTMATVVLTVGLLGAAAVLASGMQRIGGSPMDVTATAKAVEAMESVFSAREAGNLTWSQILNVKGASGSDGGVFLDGPQPMKLAGPDGLVNTADDTTVESETLPGPDQLLGTADDITVTLNNYTRQIQIRDVPNEPLGCADPGTAPCMLRSVVVTITYQDGKTTLTYTLTTYISNYS